MNIFTQTGCAENNRKHFHELIIASGSARVREHSHIIREVAAEFQNPVMLYSIGKDSAVMLHLAQKAFLPGNLPFPLLHVDTTWKFRDMISFRDKLASEQGFKLIVHTNPDGIEKGIGPISHGSKLHTEIMKTEALKQALSMSTDSMRLLAVQGGMRRNPEPRNGSFHSVQNHTAGIPSHSAPNFGNSTIPRSLLEKVFGYFHFQTGRRSISGSI